MNLLREPIVHFFALAALLFAVEAWFSADQKTQILVDQTTADFLIRQRENLELRVLDADERKAVVDAYVEDEILYSEAYRQGLDQGDSRMRRNMILKMRGLLTGEVEVPDDAQLQAYFEENREKFVRPARYDIEQIHFDAALTLPDDLNAFLAEIDRLGDGGRQDGVLLRRMPGMTKTLLAGSFGPVAGKAVLDADDNAWHGPFDSVQGLFFFRVLDRQPAVEAEFEAVRSYLQGDWMMDRSRSLIRAEVERVAEDYEVIIEAEM